MGNSAIHIDKDIVYCEYFRDRQSVLNNKYATTTIVGNPKINNGIDLKDTDSFIADKRLNGLFTVRIITEIKKLIPGNYLFDLRTKSASIAYLYSPNGIYLTNYTNNVFINGNAQYESTIELNKKIEIIVTNVIIQNGIIRLNHMWSSEFGHEQKITLFEIYNRALSASEISALYKGVLYKDPTSELNCLLDITAECGFIEDKTGKNQLTVNNVEVKRVGNSNAAYLKTTSSNIDCGKVGNNLTDFIISIWFIPKYSLSSYSVIDCANNTSPEHGWYLYQYDTNNLTHSNALGLSIGDWNVRHYSTSLKIGDINNVIFARVGNRIVTMTNGKDLTIETSTYSMINPTTNLIIGAGATDRKSVV